MDPSLRDTIQEEQPTIILKSKLVADESYNQDETQDFDQNSKFSYSATVFTKRVLS
jgi:hypothetical protein